MMGWLVLIFLSLCLPVWSAMKVIQPYKVVNTNSTVQVQCFIQPQPSDDQIQPPYHQSLSYPYTGPEELRVSLLKGIHGTQELCSSTLNFTEQREMGVEKEEEVQCSAQMRGGAVEVTVLGLKATDTDMYVCEIEVFYPPPYMRLTGNGTLIHILDSSDCPMQEAYRQTAHPGDEEQDDEDYDKMATISVSVVVLVILIVIVFIIIISFQILQCKQRKVEIARPVPGAVYKVNAAPFSCENIA